jgi:hypothetical protein
MTKCFTKEYWPDGETASAGCLFTDADVEDLHCMIGDLRDIIQMPTYATMQRE